MNVAGLEQAVAPGGASGPGPRRPTIIAGVERQLGLVVDLDLAELDAPAAGTVSVRNRSVACVRRSSSKIS